jgi:hypothetical protein
LGVKKTMRITIETERLLVIRRATSVRGWCELCAAKADMVPLESAAELAQVDVETLRHLLSSEKVHLWQPGAPVRVCLNSLLKSISKKSLERDLDERSGISTVEH